MRQRKVFILLVLAGFVILILGFALVEVAYAGTLSCEVTTAAACTSPKVVILRMSNFTNAHAELPSQSNPVYANNVVCCSNVVGLSNSCSDQYQVVLRLAGTTNAHVEQNSQSDPDYSSNACISVPSGGSVNVGYVAGDASCTPTYDDTLASMSAATNAHVGNETAYSGASNYKICASASGATFEQSAYRWFENTDSTSVVTPLADQNNPATLSSTGQAFRLRMLLHVGVSQLAQSGQQFKLQFAQRGADNLCDTGFSGESYSDVLTTGTVIAFKDNTTPADGDNLTPNVEYDPVHDSHTIANQDYEETNNFTNSVSAIPAGQDGKWDFALKDNNAPGSTTYCFRAVKADGGVLNTYTVIPQITTAYVNQPPTVDSVSISPSPITLNTGTTKTVTITATITDPDGCEDVFVSGSITGVFFDDAVENDTCAQDDNDCYSSLTLTEVDNTCTGPGDYTADASVDVNVWFIANPSSQWKAKVTATDSTSNSHSNTQTVTINTLIAFTLDISEINYGTVNPNQVSSQQAVLITTTGNAAIDVQLSGTNLTWGGNTILVGQQKYSSINGFDWETQGTALTGTPTCHELSTGKPTEHPSNQYEYVYWKLKVPEGKPAGGPYSGTNYFDVVSDTTCP